MENTLRRALVVLTLASLLASPPALATAEMTAVVPDPLDVTSPQAAANNNPWPGLEPGTRLRLRTSPRGRRIEGRLVSIDDGHLRLDRRGRELRVSLDSIHDLQAVRGRKNRLAWGLLIGGLSATLVGGAVGSYCERPCPVSFVAFVPYGLAIGGGLGALIRTPRWQPVRLGPRAQVSVAPLVDPRRRGYGLGVSARF